MSVRDDAKQTEARTEHIHQIVSRIETAVERIQHTFNDIGTGNNLTETPSQTKMLEAIWASTGFVDLTTSSAAQSPAYQPAPTRVLSEQSGENEVHFRSKILGNLFFSEMNDRSSRIKDAFPNTFQWLFGNETSDAGQPEMTFRRWLESQESTIFWITGKPASGKSTLMKFIATHESLERRLKMWAGQCRVYIAKFYFWNPGSKVQKSRIGLLRSLLHQVLTERPDLCETVMQRRRLFFDIAGDNAEAPHWEWNELRECFFRFASHVKDAGSRLALFIDGLDEYDDFVEESSGTHQSTDEMVSFLVELNQKYNAKLCVSSRPLNYFQDKFHLCDSFAMQQLTQPDIDHYVETRLRESPAIQSLADLEPESIAQLISDLKAKAQGVFLWVALVVEQLLLTSADTPRIDVIRKVFNDLPDDLHLLYKAIQKQIGPEKELIASKLYQLVMEWKRVWNSKMEATFLWLAEEQDPMQPNAYPTPDKEFHIAKLTKRLLEGHTRGILQISDPPEPSKPHMIDFLHRTAYEWLCEKDSWCRVLENGPPGYQPILSILAVLVSHVNAITWSSDSPDARWIPELCMHRIFTLAAEVRDCPETRAKLVSIIDRLDPKRLREFGPGKYNPVEAKQSWKIYQMQTGFRYRVSFQRTMPNFQKFVERSMHPTAMGWAAAYSCHPYIRGKLEMDPSHVFTPAKERFKFFARKNLPKGFYLLETAMFGFEPLKPLLSDEQNIGSKSFRIMNDWQASQRLETVKLILNCGVKMTQDIKDNLICFQSGGFMRRTDRESKHVYIDLMVEIAKCRKFQPSYFEKRKRELFPESRVRAAYEGMQFPEYEIKRP